MPLRNRQRAPRTRSPEARRRSPLDASRASARRPARVPPRDPSWPFRASGPGRAARARSARKRRGQAPSSVTGRATARAARSDCSTRRGCGDPPRVPPGLLRASDGVREERACFVDATAHAPERGEARVGFGPSATTVAGPRGERPARLKSASSSDRSPGVPPSAARALLPVARAYERRFRPPSARCRSPAPDRVRLCRRPTVPMKRATNESTCATSPSRRRSRASPPENLAGSGQNEVLSNGAQRPVPAKRGAARAPERPHAGSAVRAETAPPSPRPR